jgi:hypothetical protein
MHLSDGVRKATVVLRFPHTKYVIDFLLHIVNNLEMQDPHQMDGDDFTIDRTFARSHTF